MGVQDIMYIKFALAFVVVIGLMYLLAFALKKFGLAERSVLTGGKRRLKVVEYISLDARRKLVLVRRDDVEHLLVVGGQGEVVVETGIPAAQAADKIVELVKEQKNVQG